MDTRNLKLRRTSQFGEVSNEPSRAIGRPKSANHANGAALAILDRSLGAPKDFTYRGRGGARNSAGRESYELTKAQVLNLWAASRHAALIGLPLNRMITIHWESADVPLHQMAAATGSFLNLFSKGLARHGSGTSYIWVHENGPEKGGHAHMLVHVPPRLVRKISSLQKGWLRRITNNAYRKGVILSKPIAARLGVERTNPPLHTQNLGTALSYVLKGASIDLRLQRHEPGGYIIGKRCGTSQNIGRKARSYRGPV